MTVVFLLSSMSRRAGGMFTSARRLVQTIAEQDGVGGHVVALRDDCSDDDCPAWSPLEPILVPTRGPRSFGFSPRLLRTLQALAPDVLHSHGIWMYPSVAGSRWTRTSGRPHLVSPRGMLDAWAVRHSGWKKQIASWLFERANLRRAACLHALCESEAKAFREYGLRNPICVIPNGMDLPKEVPLDPPRWAEKVPRGARVLLFLGRIHPKKGLDNLVRAWHRLEQRRRSGRDSWHLVLAGWDQRGHENELQRLARDLELKRIHFVGPQFAKEKEASLARANAFILPSYSEGLPVAVLEAWAYGLPVVMTAGCNLAVGFRAGAALEVRPDEESIAEGMSDLMTMSDAEQHAMGSRGRDLVEKQFGWDRIAADMLRVYRWVLGGGPPPATVMT